MKRNQNVEQKTKERKKWTKGNYTRGGKTENQKLRYEMHLGLKS